MLADRQSMDLINDMEEFIVRYYDELEGRAYLDREEVGISRFYTNKIIIELSNVLELVVKLTEKDYTTMLYKGIDYAIVKAIKREVNEIDEVDNFEHALSPQDYRDEKDLANEQLLEWVLMDAIKLEQIVDNLESSMKVRGA